MTYDPKCFDLAVAFLSDDPDLDTPAARITLASEIQRAIEAELTFMRNTMKLLAIGASA